MNVHDERIQRELNGIQGIVEKMFDGTHLAIKRVFPSDRDFGADHITFEHLHEVGDAVWIITLQGELPKIIRAGEPLVIVTEEIDGSVTSEPTIQVISVQTWTEHGQNFVDVQGDWSSPIPVTKFAASIFQGCADSVAMECGEAWESSRNEQKTQRTVAIR